jgi:hypothetical protein
VAVLRFHPGAVLRIGIDLDWHTYGRMAARKGWLAIHDLKTSNADAVADLASIVRAPVLFTILVFARAYSGGRWPKVGHVPVAEHPITIPDRFMQNSSRPYDCTLIHGDEVRKASPAECVGAQPAIVWEATGVEKLLQDHYDGVPTALEQAQLRLPPFDEDLRRFAPSPDSF